MSACAFNFYFVKGVLIYKLAVDYSLSNFEVWKLYIVQSSFGFRLLNVVQSSYGFRLFNGQNFKMRWNEHLTLYHTSNFIPLFDHKLHCNAMQLQNIIQFAFQIFVSVFCCYYCVLVLHWPQIYFSHY